MKLNSSKDLVMWLLYLPTDSSKKSTPIAGRTRLIKMLFLFKEEVWPLVNKDAHIPDNFLPQFEAHHYGPYSLEVFEDLDFLIEYDFVKKEYLDKTIPNNNDFWRDLTPDDEKLQHSENVVYKISSLGVKFIESGKVGTLSLNQKSIISEFKKRCLSVPLNDLVKYVYETYPKYTKKSKIKDKIL